MSLHLPDTVTFEQCISYNEHLPTSFFILSNIYQCLTQSFSKISVLSSYSILSLFPTVFLLHLETVKQCNIVVFLWVQELLSVPEHLSSPPVLVMVHVVLSLIFCVVLCRSLVVALFLLVGHCVTVFL